jgi:dipeptidyl aminopeptidase/acylaminoacyl peptidase
MKEFSRSSLIILITVLAFNIQVSGQGTLADYKRADKLNEKFLGKVFSEVLNPVWNEESSLFTYDILSPDGKIYILVDPIKKVKQKAFDNKKLSDALSKATGKKVDPADLQISSLKFSSDRKSFTFLLDRVEWRCQLPSYRVTSGERAGNTRRNNSVWPWATRDETINDPVKSPDGKFTAYIKSYNLYIKDSDDNEIQLSYDGGIGLYYSSYIHWSPDSKKILSYKVQPAEKHIIHYIESSPAKQVQPNFFSWEYPKPGDALPQFFPQLFDLNTKSHIKVDNSAFSNQYMLGRFSWRKDSRAVTFEYNMRGHQLFQVVSLDAGTGENRILIEERSETFIDYSGKRYRYDINDGKEIIWASERDGWNHLYLYDGINGRVKNQITKGDWVVRDVEYIDTLNRKIIFMASGAEEGDPYLINYYSVGFDGNGLRRLSKGDGNHSAEFSPDMKYFIDTWSTIDTPPVSVLRRTLTGEEVMPLEKSDITKLKAEGWIAPEVFTSKGRDGITDIWGIIIRPTNFDPELSYPVIEYIYAGPHSSFVPKAFRPYIAHIHPLAELGFIVVQIDGMGTSNRSKAFHNVCFKDLKDAGFPDRILWMQAAANIHPEMDISRVGIYGTSAGGQSSTGGLLFHPEFYDVGVSSCGCHDNRMDKIWWNEQWMGWPVGPEYAESSNIENAAKLQGKLLLINGEMDYNVDPTSTIQLVNALIIENKDFEYLFIPGMGHSSGGDYGEHKRRDFFVKHLLGVDPPEWSEFK